MWYLKDAPSGKVVTTIDVGYDPERRLALINKDQLEELNELTIGIPIVFSSEIDTSLYIEDCKKYHSGWNLKVFKLMEMEWE